jgi:hypothetical protein
MQGYVTELMLTLEAAVDSLDSDSRIFGELVREFFKSTPNLNSKDNNRRSAPAVASSSVSTSSSSKIGSSSLPCSVSSAPLMRHQISSHISISIPQLLERHRLGVLEIQEHWETFNEKKEHLLECLDSIRKLIKLETLGEHIHSDSNIVNLRSDLCKCLYKMHF